MDRRRKHPDAWRLPADQVESLLTDLVRQHLHQPDAASSMTQNMSAAEIVSISEKLKAHRKATEYLELIERADLRPGTVTVLLDQSALAKRLVCLVEQVNQSGLTITSPFRMRQRGVELKLHFGSSPPEVDRTLVQNIVKARRWLAVIIDGKTFAEFAQAEGTSRRRVQDVNDLAMPAPGILDGIASGEQPDGLTTDYLIKTGFPAIWSDQHKQLADR